MDIKSTYYNNTEVRIRAEYQKMYYTYDDGYHDGEFGYR